mmetsp:Transcript_22908/g.36778  ORF Transcript_22908/g.36778 Transcript_22908/m.36778 type:complete len:444 (-) Transcript_22908:114-1445(-)
MTESFFSKIKHNKNKGPSTPRDRDHSNGFKFNHKQRLLQQASNSYQYATQIEQQLKSKEKEFGKYKKKFTVLKLENKELQSVLKIKDKELLQKTKEIARLKEQIHSLKLHVLLFKKSSKTLKTSHTHSKAAAAVGVAVAVAAQHQSSSTLQTVTTSTSKDSSTKSRQANDSNSELHQLPFIHRKTSTQTSTLSACAVALQLPSPTLHALAIPNEHNVLSQTNAPFQLSPISETNSRDEWNKSKKRTKQQQETSPTTLLRHSNDNNDIDALWGQCLADLCDDVEPTQKHTKQALAKRRSPQQQQQQDSESEASETENGADSDAELYSGDDDVSYCTDNTIMLQEIMMNIQDDGDIITPPSQQRDVEASDTSNSTTNTTPHSKSSPQSEVIVAHQMHHFSKQSNDTLSGCDRVVSAPIMFSFNQSFQVTLNERGQSNSVVDPDDD